MSEKLAVVALISGRGSNLQALLDAQSTPSYPARIVAVISNEPDAAGLHRAQTAQIPTGVVAHRDFGSRSDFETKLREVVDTHAPGLIVLAGFMRVLTDTFITHYASRIMNIHPSLLPAFPGLDTHQRALDAGVKRHGATVHFVTPTLDAGPIIVQAGVRVEPGDDAHTLAARVLTEEHRIYPLAVKWFAQHRLQIRDGRVLKDGKPVKPKD